MGDELYVQIGELKGRIGAIDGRLDRHDSALVGMDKKLDEILTAVAKSDGRRSVSGMLLNFIIAIVGALAGVLGAKISHAVP